MNELPAAENGAPPTIDDGEPGAVEYRDWTRETTRVVSGPMGIHPASECRERKYNWAFQAESGPPRFPGTWFETAREARRHWEAKGYRVFENLSVVNRWILRISRGPVR